MYRINAGCGCGTPSYYLLTVTSRQLFCLDRHNYFPMLPGAVGATFNASITSVRYSSGEPLRFGSPMEQKRCYCAPSYIADMRCGTYFRRPSLAPTECFPQGLKIFSFWLDSYRYDLLETARLLPGNYRDI